jgi:hypothetical protein
VETYLRLIMLIANKEFAITFPRIMYFPTMHTSIKIKTALFTFLIVSEQKCSFMSDHTTNNANDRTKELMIIYSSCQYYYKNITQTWTKSKKNIVQPAMMACSFQVGSFFLGIQLQSSACNYNQKDRKA